MKQLYVIKAKGKRHKAQGTAEEIKRPGTLSTGLNEIGGDGIGLL
jgi:hypothetical protein